MKKEKFSININASAKKVWQVLWSDATYRKWTSAFTEGISEGSYAVSDWKQGSKIQFLGSPSGDGMFGIISELKPFEKMAFSHQGELKNFKEQPPKEGSAVPHRPGALTYCVPRLHLASWHNRFAR